jgi:hypothetical protein
MYWFVFGSCCHGNTLPMLSPDSIDNTAKSKADSERCKWPNIIHPLKHNSCSCLSSIIFYSLEQIFVLTIIDFNLLIYGETTFICKKDLTARNDFFNCLQHLMYSIFILRLRIQTLVSTGPTVRYKILSLLYKRALFDLQFVHNLFWLKLKWSARSKLVSFIVSPCFDEVQGHWQN